MTICEHGNDTEYERRVRGHADKLLAELDRQRALMEEMASLIEELCKRAQNREIKND
jgi:hypothetical protein